MKNNSTRQNAKTTKSAKSTQSVTLSLTRKQAEFVRDVLLGLAASVAPVNAREGTAAVRKAWAAEKPKFLALTRGRPGDAEHARHLSEAEDADDGLEVAELFDQAMAEPLTVLLPAKRRLHRVRLRPETMAKLDAVARAQGRARNELMAEVIGLMQTNGSRATKLATRGASRS
jgi:uncharacterized protein YcbK (DUF882 family)